MPDETERKDILEFSPEERAEADTSFPNLDQWNERDGVSDDDDAEPETE